MQRSKPIDATPHRYVRSSVQFSMTLLFSLILTSCIPEPSSIDPGVTGDGQFNSIIEQIVRDRNIPALSVVIVQDNQVVDSTAVGLRSFEHTARIDEEDQWQVGSITKTITATLAAKLVDMDILQWDTRIDESFSEHIDQINSDLHNITLAELLQHRAGLVRHPIPTGKEKDNNDRLGFLLRTLNTSVSSKRGQYSYSNYGYLVAGVMIEQSTGMSWENAMESYLFSELGIVDFGFGVPDAGAEIAQPIGHLKRLSTSSDRVNDYWLPVVSDEDTFLSQLMLYGPAGSLYLNKRAHRIIQQLHLDGTNNKSDFLSQSSFDRLHIPDDGYEYAMGWYNEDSEAFEQINFSEDERVLAHGGKTGTWSAYSVLLPDRNISILMASNSDIDDQNEILEILLKRLRVI